MRRSWRAPKGRAEQSLASVPLEGLGQLAFRRGQPRDAIRQFEEALRLYGDPECRHSSLADSLGRAYASIGELESSIRIFERCLEEGSEFGIVWMAEDGLRPIGCACAAGAAGRKKKARSASHGGSLRFSI